MFSVSKHVLNSSLDAPVLVGVTKIEGSTGRWKNVNNDIELDFDADYAVDFELKGINGGAKKTIARMYPSTLKWADAGNKCSNKL